jgi:predicted Zn-dependent protease
LRLYGDDFLSFKRLGEIYVMTQSKTATGETLGVLLGSEHCPGNVLNGVVSWSTREWGYCVTCIIMLSTVWW